MTTTTTLRKIITFSLWCQNFKLDPSEKVKIKIV